MKKTILLCFALLLMVVVAGCSSKKEPVIKLSENTKDVEIVYEVVLVDAGDNALDVVKEIRNNAGLDLAGSKKVVDEAPATVASELSKEEAEDLKTVLEAAGATVEVKEIERPKSTDSKGEKTEFEVVLVDAGENMLEVVKEIRNNTELGLAESKEIVDEAPKTVASGLSKEEAENLKKVLEAVGATVEIK